MKLISFIVCCLAVGCATYPKYTTPAIPDGYYYDEHYNLILKIKENYQTEIKNYKAWRKEKPKSLYINYYLYREVLDSIVDVEPKIDFSTPQVPDVTRKQGNGKPYTLIFQFEGDTLGQIVSAQLLYKFEGLETDINLIAELQDNRMFGWKHEDLSVADKEMIRESLIKITTWKFSPGILNGKKVPFLATVPIKIKF